MNLVTSAGASLWRVGRSPRSLRPCSHANHRRKFAGFGADRRASEWKEQSTTTSTMKKNIVPLLAATFLALPSVIGQPVAVDAAPASVSTQISNLVKFDLEFPGGTPRQFVEAIEKASGKRLNAVIPDEDAGLRLPALKMRAVNVWDLFQALSVSSRRTILTSSSRVASVEYGFSTVGNLSENSIWYFYQHRSPRAWPKATRMPIACSTNSTSTACSAT